MKKFVVLSLQEVIEIIPEVKKLMGIGNQLTKKNLPEILELVTNEHKILGYEFSYITGSTSILFVFKKV